MGIFFPKNVHICTADGALLSKIKVGKALKEKCRTTKSKSSKEIVMDVLKEANVDLKLLATFKSFTRLVILNINKNINTKLLILIIITVHRQVQRIRQPERPPQPKSLEFDLTTTHLPDSFLVEDIRINKQRHIVFATPHQQALAKRNKFFYIDATFKVLIFIFFQTICN